MKLLLLQVGKIAIEMGVFETLSEGGATCQSLAEKFSMSEVHLEKLLNSLCALRLLKKTKTKENGTIFTKNYKMWWIPSVF